MFYGARWRRLQRQPARELPLSVARGVAWTLGAALWLAARPASAEPQWSIGVDPALCRESSDTRTRWAFCGDLHSDLIFGRERERDIGFGPYTSVGTVAFDELRAAAGLTLLVPTLEDFGLGVSAGGLIDDAGRVGLDTELFFGVRSYNFHGVYNFAAGLVVGAERSFGDDPSTLVTLGFRVDGFFVAAPFLLAWGALQ